MKVILQSSKDMVDYCNYLHDKQKLGQTLVDLLGEIELYEEIAEEFFTYKHNILEAPTEESSEAKTPSVTVTSCRRKREGKLWHPQEVTLLGTYLEQNVDVNDIAKEMQRSVWGIRCKARKAYNKCYQNHTWTYLDADKS